MTKQRLKREPKSVCIVECEKLKDVLRLCEKIVMDNNEDESNPVLLGLYKIIHIAIGDCSNPHNDWREIAGV